MKQKAQRKGNPVSEQAEKPAFFWRQIVQIYQQTFKMFKSHPMIVLLFLIMGLVDLSALMLLFLAHSAPMADIIGPVIRYLWGDEFLHYPKNFLLLPKLYGHAHLVLLAIIGVLVTGIVVKKIEGVFRDDKEMSLASAFMQVLPKYFGLVAVFVLTYLAGSFSVRVLLPFIPADIKFQYAFMFILALLFQAVFAFVIPAILILRKGFIKNVMNGLLMGLKKLPITMALISVPVLFLVGLSYLKALSPVFVQSAFPDIVLIVLISGVLITALVDLVITSSTTLLFLKARS